jgi:hypothetical protein
VLTSIIDGFIIQTVGKKIIYQPQKNSGSSLTKANCRFPVTTL